MTSPRGQWVRSRKSIIPKFNVVICKLIITIQFVSTITSLIVNIMSHPRPPPYNCLLDDGNCKHWRNGAQRGKSITLQWRHNECDGVPNHQPHDCLLNRLFRCRLKKTWKLRVTSLCEGNSPVPGEFPAQRTSDAEIFSIWWRHHGIKFKGFKWVSEGLSVTTAFLGHRTSRSM